MEIDAYYAAHRADFDRPAQVRARQIVVADRAAGEQVLNELRRGAAFADVAKRASLSPDAANGGDLGFFSKGQMVPAFEQAVREQEFLEGPEAVVAEAPEKTPAGAGAGMPDMGGMM